MVLTQTGQRVGTDHVDRAGVPQQGSEHLSSRDELPGLPQETAEAKAGGPLADRVIRRMERRDRVLQQAGAALGIPALVFGGSQVGQAPGSLAAVAQLLSEPNRLVED